MQKLHRFQVHSSNHVCTSEVQSCTFEVELLGGRVRDFSLPARVAIPVWEIIVANFNKATEEVAVATFEKVHQSAWETIAPSCSPVDHESPQVNLALFGGVESGTSLYRQESPMIRHPTVLNFGEKGEGQVSGVKFPGMRKVFVFI